MTVQECIKGRRSIRKFKPDKIEHELLSEIVETASFAPSWKNTQITRYIAVEGELKDKIAAEGTTPFPGNGAIIANAPVLIAVTVIKNRCGYERDGSFTTPRKDTWQMYDAGIASQTFCLAAYDKGVGSVILGIFDQAKISYSAVSFIPVLSFSVNSHPGSFFVKKDCAHGIMSVPDGISLKSSA